MLSKFLIFSFIIILLLSTNRLYSKNEEINQFKCKDCNVILIGIDTLRADHLSAYGYTKIKTPNIDSLAENGVLFEKNYSQSINTTPSFMSIFTSLYPTDHGILDTSIPKYLSSNEFIKINDEITTMTQILQGNGYNTQAFVTSPALSSNYGFSKGFNNYQMGKIETERKKFIDWLSNNRDRKFFVFLHDLTLHSPYDTKNKYSELEDDPAGFLSKFDTKISSNMNLLTNLYDKNIEDVDNYIGLIIKTLEKERLMDKTIIIFVSDHGEELGDHGALSHKEFYNEIIHVPLIIYFPGLNKSIKISQNTRSIDIMPTILDIIETKTNSPMRGISLLTTFTKDMNLPIVSIMNNNKSIILDNYKFIDQKTQQESLEKKQTMELYNLKNDPLERNNLIEKNLPIQKILTDYLTKTINESKYLKPVVQIKKPESQKEIQDQIKTLGY